MNKGKKVPKFGAKYALGDFQMLGETWLKGDWVRKTRKIKLEKTRI